MKPLYNIQQIKQRINVLDIAKRCGLPITKPGDRCVSPLREGASNPTSFVCDTDFFYDFGSGVGGDVIDFLAEIKYSGDRGAAIRELASLTGVPDDSHSDSSGWLEYTQRLNARTAFYHSQLTPDDRKYLYGRGLTDDDIDRLMIGRVTDGSLRGRLFLPYFNSGYVCYYATRALPGGAFPENKYMKQRRDDYCRHLPWGLQTLNRDHDTLVIAEGYFDAVSFETRGYPVISAITGNFSREQIPTVLSVARKFKSVFLVYDNDATTHAGAKFTERMATLLSKNRIPFSVGSVPEPYHDVSEYFAAGGDLSRLISNAQDGIQYISGTFTTFEQLEQFLYPISRYIKRTRLDELFAYLSGLRRWNEKTLNSLYRSCTTAPSEPNVAEDVLRKHQILYITSIGFYEYSRGCWLSRSDDQIKSYIDRAYGEFSSNQRLNAVCGLLKIRANREVDFDRKPVWNFINGTLELDTGNFREHNPDDYCSIQASYPYNPDATYSTWAKFISDVSGDDPKTEELLQFIPAYALFHDCPHEKIFVLTGSGGNGKTRYLDALACVFGENNCTHLPPRALLDKFQLIQLKNSIINLAGEIRSDLRDAEEIMKLIASGEPISACYKGQQFVTFRSRSKLVYACNGQLASGDTSEGLTRRLIILDFKMQFVDNPDPCDPFQCAKDIYIGDKLAEEINSGGVFNWIYNGYKLLKTVGYFTETNDQTNLIADFKRASNPILVFYEETKLPDEITNKELFEKYCQWCSDTNERPKAAIGFHREFKSVASRDFEPFRNANERGYRRK